MGRDFIKKFLPHSLPETIAAQKNSESQRSLLKNQERYCHYKRSGYVTLEAVLRNIRPAFEQNKNSRFCETGVIPAQIGCQLFYGVLEIELCFFSLKTVRSRLLRRT